MMSDTICTGSHLNQRTFKEDDFWESFQSTLISGQVLSADYHHEDTSVDELSTMIEDEMSEENTLNMNLDAIPDAELFFDCPSFEKSPANLVKNAATFRILSPRPYTRSQFYTVQFSSPPKTSNNNNSRNNNINCAASPRKQRPESARRISPARISATLQSSVLSSPSDAGTRTGSLLVEMAQEFDNDLTDHAQSTPKLSSDSGHPPTASFIEEVSAASSSCPSELDEIERVRKTLDFHNAETMVIEQKPVDVNASNKEKFFNDKFVTRRRGTRKPSPVRTRFGKVRLLTGYFQSFASESVQVKSSLPKSRIPLPVRLSPHVKKSPQAKARISASPTYQTRKSYKLLSSHNNSKSHPAIKLSTSRSLSHNNSKIHPATATTYSSSGSESFLTRNQRKFPARTSRVQSCSDATNAEIMSIDETCKSHSTGNLPSDSTCSVKALPSSKIYTRTYLLAGKKSPMKKLSPLKKVSAIQNRRSIGEQLRKKNATPVKPVKELCKLFVTPSKRATGKVTQKSLVVPKIVITRN